MGVLIEESTAADAVGREVGGPACRRVVVGVDGSPGSWRALVHALAVGARQKTAVEVVTSYAVPPFWSGEYPVDPPAPASLRVDTEARLEEFVDEVRRSSVRAGAPGADSVPPRLVVSAHPAVDALLERAGNDGLLVVGSRGRGAPSGAMLGSVSLDCMTRAVGPFLVVPAPVPARVAATRTPPLVVAGVDGSVHSRAALALALAEARRTGAQVEVVHAYESTDHWVYAGPGEMPAPGELAEQARRRVDDVVREVTHGMQNVPRLRTLVAQRPAVDLLLERSRIAALLVVGRRGSATQAGTVPGSVALQSALRGSCPVLVAPPEESR